MGKVVQSAAVESGQPIKRTGTADHLLYPPAYYHDCVAPFSSLRQAWRYCQSEGSPFFIGLLTVKAITAYDNTKQRVPWPSGFQRRPVRLSILFESEAGELWGTVFGGVFAWKDVAPGDRALIRAKFDDWNGKIQLASIERFPISFLGRTVPIYYANRRLGPKADLADLASEALGTRRQEAVATLLQRAQTDERSLLTEAGVRFQSLEAVLEGLHAPFSGKEGVEALDAAHALSVAALRMSKRRFETRPSHPQSVLSGLEASIQRYASRLPFPLTADQHTAIAEVVADLGHHQPMNRLISGDVGTGKTLTYLLPALAAHAAGAHVGILIPNLLVASQVAGELAALAPEVPQLLITGSSGKARFEGRPIVIGTTAMLSRLAKYPLHFAIIDEQHKLSEAQRSKLVQPYTNVLEATATAVPRTAALVEFGAMDVSLLRQCPYQKNIVTNLVQPSIEEKKRVMQALRATVSAGGQVAVVYPRLSASDNNRGIDNSTASWERLFPDQVVVLHGQMDDGEKQAAVDKMRSGQASVLVATTVIEVGITLPSLKAILIVDPDRLGLAQLHQLRGRVARHGGDGLCYLMPGKELEDETAERLKLMERYSSGFELQEADLAMRGFGALLSGESQTGNASVLFEGIKLRPGDF
ncbi:helicase-related protein [Crenobacter sp. SG2305]|uniref:helicase-related protein n=1 Tax=Crenobacter oryzisoli TaxID=3056844 RepID=UPI0025AAC6C1|nr:helicase-related protein [Crenobacter sp. SG2305]MDN0082335.1 helicase-related protein [Crenobacter sp. SG2305]